MTDSELIKHIQVLKDNAYTMLIKNSTDYHTILTGIKIESFDFVCNEMIKRLMSGNEKEHEFYTQFMKIWKESDFPEELEMYTSDLLIQLGINEDNDNDDQ